MKSESMRSAPLGFIAEQEWTTGSSAVVSEQKRERQQETAAQRNQLGWHFAARRAVDQPHHGRQREYQRIERPNRGRCPEAQTGKSKQLPGLPVTADPEK